MLGGPGKIVEIDESCFSKKRKFHRGRGGRRIHRWVFGMVERGSNRFRLWLVPNRRRETLLPIIRDNIAPGTIIISDHYNVYQDLNNENDYIHFAVNHSIQFVDDRHAGIHTDTIEGRWTHVKRHLNSSGGTRDGQISERLDEYMFITRFLKGDPQYRVFRLLRCIALQGIRAKNYVSAL